MRKVQNFHKVRTIDNRQKEVLIESELRRVLHEILVDTVQELQEDWRFLVIALLLLQGSNVPATVLHFVAVRQPRREKHDRPQETYHSFSIRRSKPISVR